MRSNQSTRYTAVELYPEIRPAYQSLPYNLDKVIRQFERQQTETPEQAAKEVILHLERLSQSQIPHPVQEAITAQFINQQITTVDVDALLRAICIHGQFHVNRANQTIAEALTEQTVQAMKHFYTVIKQRAVKPLSQLKKHYR